MNLVAALGLGVNFDFGTPENRASAVDLRAPAVAPSAASSVDPVDPVEGM